MITGNERFTTRGRVAQIISPEKQDDFMLPAKLRKLVEGKYLVVIEDENLPLKGWARWKYQIKNSGKSLRGRVIMQACPYSVGEVVELSVAKVLVPSGLYTTEG